MTGKLLLILLGKFALVAQADHRLHLSAFSPIVSPKVPESLLRLSDKSDVPPTFFKSNVCLTQLIFRLTQRHRTARFKVDMALQGENPSNYDDYDGGGGAAPNQSFRLPPTPSPGFRSSSSTILRNEDMTQELKQRILRVMVDAFDNLQPPEVTESQVSSFDSCR
jgi:hypothetical protein